MIFIYTSFQKKLNYKQLVKMSQNFNTTEILSTVQISGRSQTFSLFYDEICHHEICLSFFKSIFTSFNDNYCFSQFMIGTVTVCQARPGVYTVSWVFFY